MKKSIVGIGSALVDILTRIDNDGILEELNIPKGSMQLVDEKSSAIIEGKLAKANSQLTKVRWHQVAQQRTQFTD